MLPLSKWPVTMMMNTHGDTQYIHGIHNTQHNRDTYSRPKVETKTRTTTQNTKGAGVWKREQIFVWTMCVQPQNTYFNS